MSEKVEYILTINNTGIKSGIASAQAEVGKLDSKISAMSAAGYAAIIAGAYKFESAIISTRAEFEKFEAMLTTALGSGSSAESSMRMLSDFAAKTPFSVKEITEAYVKLANRGITPSKESLTKMGDVAAALGKPLEKVNEAILDINNTERWNELGIKVKTNGNKITGTFKGITYEAARTEQGALSLITRFGEMQGVMGGMELQSKTLGGQISNLGDNFDTMFNELGRSQGVLGPIMEMFNESMAKGNAILRNFNNIDSKLRGTGHERSWWQKFTDGPQTNLTVVEENVNAKIDAFTNKISELSGSDSDVKKFNDELGETKKQLDIILKAANAVKKEGGIEGEEYQQAIELIKAGYNDLDKIAADKIKRLGKIPGANTVLTKESSKVKSTQYTQITINIDEVLGADSVKVTNSNLEGTAGTVAGAFAKALIEILADAQVLTGG